MKKKCLKKKQPGEKPSCPSKTSKKNPNPNFIKAYSKEEIDKLKKIFNSLSEKNYKDRPISLGLKTSPNIIKDDIPLLEKIFSITSFSFVTPLEIKYKEEYENNNNALKKEKEIEKEKCSICQYNFYEEEEEKISNIKKEKKFDEYLKINLNVILLDKCTDHFFHIECISMLVKNKESFKCPVCSKIYGILYGDMPDGTMKAFITENRHCSGYKDVGTIVIDYFFPGVLVTQERIEDATYQIQRKEKNFLDCLSQPLIEDLLLLLEPQSQQEEIRALFGTAFIIKQV